MNRTRKRIPANSSLNLVFRPMRPNMFLILSNHDAFRPAHRSSPSLSLCAFEPDDDDEKMGRLLDNLRMWRTKKPEFCVEKDG